MQDLRSQSGRPPVDLPAGYRWAGSAEGWLALWDERADELQREGYSAGTDAPLIPSRHAGRANLAEVALPEGTVLVRRFRHGGLLRGVTGERYLTPHRPFTELVLSEQLREAGFLTPRVVAARAQRHGPFNWRLELVTERVEGTRDLGYVLKEARAGELTDGLRRSLCHGAGELIGNLHGAGFLHADLQPANLLCQEIAPEDGHPDLDAPRPPRLWVLDLDGSSWRHPLGYEERLGNLRRLWRNVERRERSLGASLTLRDQARFLRAYDPVAWRRLLVEIEASRARREPLHRVGHALDGSRRIRNDPRTPAG